VVAGTRAINGVTHVEVNTLERRLVVRYDTTVTTEAAIAAGIDAVISNIGR
jgi:hypothetical protein